MYGVNLYNNSHITLQGDPNSEFYDGINYITNNGSYELYASVGSFPWYFRYNAIIDNDNLGNPTDPMVYYEPPEGGFPLMDVKYNCWGSGFTQSEDLYPSGYMVAPTWCPSGGGQKSSEMALQIFQVGLKQFEDSYYTDAKSTFESVIESYPKTQYASASMKELLELENFLGNNYSSLRNYYETNDSIQANTVLTKLAVFLSNKCEIEMENWQTAIDHFEGIIENPDTPEDSVFAIIDLGYTYFLMENSNKKSSAQGRLLQHKPTSNRSFSAKRASLLALLPFAKKERLQEDIAGSPKTGELLQNVPNPFSTTTTVVYRLKAQANVMFKVYDHLGKEVLTIGNSVQDKGVNKTELDMGGMPTGFYFYSLFINGQLSDTKKMVAR